MIRIYAVAILPAGPDVQGYAMPEMRRVYIYGPHLAQQAGGDYLKWMTLLGTVIAHEVGHLAGLTHEPRGIMRGGWSARELFDVQAGRLHFTDGEAGKLKAWAARQATVLSWSR